jgi:hypothetical protein
VPTPIPRNHVFINCPFDHTYKPIFDAIVFAVHDLGFVARSALEIDDGSEVRLTKIERIIEECRYGIHDISNVALDANTGLPRFNMPLELGLFFGCKRFGDERQRKKVCIILDSEPYRYRQCISDISGQDIHSHGGTHAQAIIKVRNWLAAASKPKFRPGGAEIVERYNRFLNDLPALCTALHRQPDDLTFGDLSETIETWLQTNR